MPKYARVVNIKLHPHDIYIGRDRENKVSPHAGERGFFGSPFKIKYKTITGKIGGQYNRNEAMSKYEAYFYKKLGFDPVFEKEIKKLKGKVLGCYCVPQKCHGDIIAQYLNTARFEDDWF